MHTENVYMYSICRHLKPDWSLSVALARGQLYIRKIIFPLNQNLMFAFILLNPISYTWPSLRSLQADVKGHGFGVFV